MEAGQPPPLTLQLCIACPKGEREERLVKSARVSETLVPPTITSPPLLSRAYYWPYDHVGEYRTLESSLRVLGVRRGTGRGRGGKKRTMRMKVAKLSLPLPIPSQVSGQLDGGERSGGLAGISHNAGESMFGFEKLFKKKSWYTNLILSKLASCTFTHTQQHRIVALQRGRKEFSLPGH